MAARDDNGNSSGSIVDAFTRKSQSQTGKGIIFI